MTYAYNSLLVFVSILVAIVGAYACFDLVIRVQRSDGLKRRQWLALASLAIGGSIWSMHFIAMVAVQLDMTMRYDKLLTLVSGLASIFMTAVALAIVSTVHASWMRVWLGGAIMGIGIICMHYVGMAGMRGNFALIYQPAWVAVSVLIGIVASTMSLWIVLRLHLRGVVRRLSSAFVMGLSIAGVHYSAMFGTSFVPNLTPVSITRPDLDPVSLGMITALVTFALLAWALLSLLPETSVASEAGFKVTDLASADIDKSAIAPGFIANENSVLSQMPAGQGETVEAKQAADKLAGYDAPPNSIKSESANSNRIPVQRNKETHFLPVRDVVSISADGHYCNIKTADSLEHFCNVGFNKLLDAVDNDQLVRVHRSHAVNLEYVISFQRQHDKGILSMGEDKHKIAVSRSYVPAVKAALGLTKVR